MAMARSLSPLFAIVLVTVVRAVPAVDNLQDACNKTQFPKVCIQALTTNPECRTANARRLAELSVYVAAEVGTAVEEFTHYELNLVGEHSLFKCVDSCSDDIEEAVAHLSALTRELTDAKFLEVKAWLSATLGGTSTCEDNCKDTPNSEIKNAVVTKSLEFEKLLRVTLDLITEASGSMSADVAVPPSSWDASAPSYGSASAPGPSPSDYSATVPATASNGPTAASVDIPSPSPSIAISKSSGDAYAPSTSSGAADAPSPSSGAADAPSTSSGAADAPSPSSGAADAPSTSSSAAEAPSSSYGADDAPSASSSAADTPSPSSGSADVPSPSYGSADAPSPSSGAADAPSPSSAATYEPAPSSGAGAPEADAAA
ncbi:hypothetical protein ABZP36_001108 [Zizania latifolia]